MRTGIVFIFLSIVASHGRAIGQDFDSIKVNLEQIYTRSLKLRSQVSPTIRNFGIKSHQMDSLNHVIINSDSLDLIYIRKLIDSYGWLGINSIGQTGNQVLFLAIQHSNLGIMEKYYPLLKQSVIIKQSRMIDLALLEDRILVLKSLPQKYGTQYRMDPVSNKMVYFPIEDIKGIEKRRRKVGLGSFKKYSKQNNISQ